MSGARQKNKRAERRDRIVAFGGGGLATGQGKVGNDERARWERRESRLHYVCREGGEGKENICPLGRVWKKMFMQLWLLFKIGSRAAFAAFACFTLLERDL